jgi:hypothetical protein
MRRRMAGVLLGAISVMAVLAAGCGRDEGARPAVTGASELSLVGTWEGERQRLADGDGYRKGPARLVVTRQIGRTFRGTMRWSTPDGPVREPLVGAFTGRGQLMAGADAEGNYSFALVNRRTLDYCYAEHGRGYRTTCARLSKQR